MLAPKYSISYDDVVINVYHANKGEGLPAHEHLFSHLTMCHSGSCVIRKEKGERIVGKNSTPLNLIAKEWHEIEALEDGTVFVNIFSQKKQ